MVYRLQAKKNRRSLEHRPHKGGKAPSRLFVGKDEVLAQGRKFACGATLELVSEDFTGKKDVPDQDPSEWRLA
jgi:hypothetical protein